MKNFTNVSRKSRGPRAFRLFTAGLSLLLCYATSVTDVSAKILRWNLLPGQQYQLTVDRVVNQSSPVADWSETVRYQLLWVVAGKEDDGTTEIVQTLVGVQHTLRFPDTPPVAYDSSDDGEPRGDAVVLAKRWAGKINAEQRLTLKANGELAISETDASTPAAAAGVPASVGVSSWQPIPKLLQGTECILPLVDMSVDYDWSTTQFIPWGEDEASLKLTTVYRYRGTESVDEVPLDVIESVTRWEVVPKPGTVTPLVIERQAGRGTLFFDTAAGYIARADRSENLVVRILRPGVEPTQANLDTTLKIRCEALESVPIATAEPETSLTSEQ